MPYDSSLDKQISSKVFEIESGRISVAVYSYNNGPNKLHLGRETKDAQGNYRFAKLGRLTKEELEGILPLIQETLSSM